MLNARSRMERAGRPRHRSHNPRGEGKRAGGDRIKAFGVETRPRFYRACKGSSVHQTSLRKTSLIAESSADSSNGLMSTGAFTRLKKNSMAGFVWWPVKKMKR